MSRRALHILEFRKVLEYVARFAATPGGREAVVALQPFADIDEVRIRLASVDETARFLTAHDDWVFPPVPETAAAIGRLAVEGSVLPSEELAALGGLLGAGSAVRKALAEGAGGLPTLLALKDVLLAVPGLETAIGRAVDPQGVVLDGASRELARIRGQLAGAHNRVVAHLEGLLEGVDERHRVPGASVSIREGRYVIPLRREGRRAVGGYVHDESSSGATLFVEPPSAIEMMNRVRGLERAEAREVLRILRDLSERCRPLAGAMADSLGALTEMDRRVALARAAGRWDGCVPEMTDGPVCIRGGRHPLLVAAGIEPVPFDLELDQDEGVVVVTGPNTGGKTVFLKSVGLVSALAQSGVVPPTGPGTRLPVFTSFFAESGDGQSIADSLSTFSAHLRSLRTILENAESRSLVLIDEPGAGTDPREGEALARALVETLAERGCTAVVTSHLGALRRLAAPGNRIVNASLHFDGERLAPTYHFTKGRPGRSYGLAIARGLGFPEEVLDRAEGYRDRREARLDELLDSLQAKERRVSRTLAELDGERGRTAALRAEVEEREKHLRRTEREHSSRARRRARRMLLEARAKVEAAIAGFEERAREGVALREAARAARREVEEAARELEESAAPGAGGGLRAGPAADSRANPGLEPGARVRVVDSGARGTVVDVEGRRVVVNVGGMRLRVGCARVVRDDDAQDGAGPARPGWTAPAADPSAEVDLRGQRADEAELSLSRALDAASVADLRELRVIHGKGTGALRERVTAVLGRDARVERFRAGKPGEGGFGVTVVRIR
ncbi:MAG: Smr/MutS family protein [Gemmatimonadota bacterium]|nr:Smr/MutS family protein [Gemmatimonadota bacterium]MDE2872268.1 Smr/MutS family protein [Gemmatimonadota bacterium]